MGMADVEGCCSLETTNTVGGKEGLRASFLREGGLVGQAQFHSWALQEEEWLRWIPGPELVLGSLPSLLLE